MSLPHQSVATISSPQFINLQPLDINPLMSKCEIKVLYLGANRNGSYISKQAASEMAKTLRGAPIVGYYKDNSQDFRDHGQQIVIDGDGVRFRCLTKPYGFVAPDAQVWFKDFQDQDEFNNSVVRTYLMTTGYLWTGQFEQVKDVIDNGRPQSMELDEKTLQGHWSRDVKKDMQFFIINDAIFTKLCILGDDVEPCFEGSAVTAPQISTSFTLDNEFKKSLFKMMEELKYALEGGNNVADIKDKASEVEENISDMTFTEKEEEKTLSEENLENQEPLSEFTSEESAVEPEKEVTTTFDGDNDDDDDDDTEEETEEEQGQEEVSDDDDETKKKYTALKEEYDQLKADFDALEQERDSLKAFKLEVENAQKDELIGKFFMLPDEDKKEIIENKEKYTLEEIKAKLAVICFDKKVNFNLEESSENKDNKKETVGSTVTTYNINLVDSITPDWVKEVESVMNE